MVRSYLRFEPDAAFGVITSNSNILWTEEATGSSAGRVITGALESLLEWDLKTGDRIFKLNDIEIKAEISCIAKHEQGVYAAGYSDGSIRVWDSKTESVIVSFSGHKTAITVLKFDRSGTRMVSGSRDTNIIVWDLITEVGLFRLRSHKDQITGLEFLYDSPKIEEENHEDVQMEADDESEIGKWLVSTSKDGFIKLWNLESQHCVETHVAHRGECWALGVRTHDLQSGELEILTAGGQGELKIWQVNLSAPVGGASDDNRALKVKGTLMRSSKDRAVTVSYHPTAPYVAVHGTDRAVEIWRIRSANEVHKSLLRKRRRRREKLAAKGEEIEEDKSDVDEDDVLERYIPFVIVRTTSRIRSIDWAMTNSDEVRKESMLHLAVGLIANSVEMYSITIPQKKSKGHVPEYERVYVLDMPGHRTDVRSVCVSSDDGLIATASNGSLKIWNIKTTNCIRTFECGYALTSAFLPGDTIIVVGTKEGKIEIFDVASSTLMDTIDAHEGALWSLQTSPDGKSIVTGSADKTVKFWEIRVIQEEIPGTSRTRARMTLKHRRTLELTEDILAVRLSPDGRYVCVSLLDSTVKVFFADTLKFFLNLYGHKLPVLSMDVSYDSKILITCSADKNIKIWGLDFGDCHRSLYAHEDSIMSVQFVPETHNFFSASKDGLVKYWDGDKFENIQKLEGHRSEVWALAVGYGGDYVVSVSHDKSIRIWMQTEDQVFVEEEREREMEQLYETALAGSLGNDDQRADDGDEVTAKAGAMQTVETLVAGERIAEALDLAMEDIFGREATKAAGQQESERNRNIVFVANGEISAERYVLGVVEKIRASALADALLLVPFEKVAGLIKIAGGWASQGWNVPLAGRILVFVVGQYYRQIASNEGLRTTLDETRTNIRRAISRARDEMGLNLAGLGEVRRVFREGREHTFEDEAEAVSKKRVFTTV
ncbi:WD40-repeat-containing domain protein [Lipomyces oligophaga]|uniref:WD40-repeat-containing domain protein n=1 Tax=Lipomyces oligophaga TaxID=45792 RepID=UPI0034CF47B6